MEIKDAYDLWSKTYDSNVNATRDLDKKVTKEILSNYAFNKVLELGCGSGKNSEFFLSISKKVIGIDFSSGMLNVAKQKISDDRFNIIEGDINLDWQIDESSIDLISSNLVLEHIENLNFIFQQAKNALVPNGYFYISELHPYKQYLGSKARFESGDIEIKLETFIHHITDFINAAKVNGFMLEKLDEHFDRENNLLPRLVSFLFRKI